MGRRHMVAGVAGEHCATLQCDLPHMGRSDRPDGPRAPPRRSRNRAGRYRKRRDRLVGVTRPRPPVAPAMAGAVDLSALKQRAAAASEGAAPARRPRPNGVEITEANLEAEVLVRSNQVPVVVLLWSPRSDASVAAGRHAVGPGVRRRRQVVAGHRECRHRAAGGPDVRRAAVPTVVALAAGQPLSSFQGLQPADQLRGWIDSLLNATAASSAAQPIRATRRSRP